MNTVHTSNPPLDLNLLRVFEAVLTTRSITQAASRLGLTQSSTSHSLNRLRMFFGDPLFVRTKRSMEPTPRAVELSRPIAEALQLIQGTVERRRSFDPVTSNRTFSIAMTDIGQTMYLPRLMPYLGSEAPNVNLTIHQLARETIRDRLESGTVDLAIGPIGGLESGFYQQRLYDSTWICALRKNHPRIKEVLTMEAFLAESHLVISPPGTVHGGSLDAAFAVIGAKRRVALKVPSFHTAAQILSVTDLIAAVPRGFLEVEAATHSLRTLGLPFATDKLVVRQFWHERFHEDGESRWLRRVVHQLFGDGAEPFMMESSLADTKK